jgi:hypothetical protein
MNVHEHSQNLLIHDRGSEWDIGINEVVQIFTKKFLKNNTYQLYII